MKKMILATAMAILALGSANAADTADPIVDDVFGWGGFYAGVHGSYSSGEADFVFRPGNTITSQTDIKGVSGGGQIGYNIQSGNWVFGIEADISKSGIDGSNSCPNATFNCDVEIDWLATFRARAGVAHKNILVYGTAGLALADFNFRSPRVATGIPLRDVDDRGVGFVVGAGLEYALNQNWSVKGEYLFHSFEDLEATPVGLSAIDYEVDVHSIKFGINYRF